MPKGDGAARSADHNLCPAPQRLKLRRADRAVRRAVAYLTGLPGFNLWKPPL